MIDGEEKIGRILWLREREEVCDGAEQEQRHAVVDVDVRDQRRGHAQGCIVVREGLRDVKVLTLRPEACEMQGRKGQYALQDVRRREANLRDVYPPKVAGQRLCRDGEARRRCKMVKKLKVVDREPAGIVVARARLNRRARYCWRFGLDEVALDPVLYTVPTGWAALVALQTPAVSYSSLPPKSRVEP